MSKHPYHRLPGILFLTVYVFYHKIVLKLTQKTQVHPTLSDSPQSKKA